MKHTFVIGFSRKASSSLLHLVASFFCLISVLDSVSPEVHAEDNGFLYTITSDVSGNSINGFSVDEITGALTALSGFPVATGGSSLAANNTHILSLDRVNLRLYAINDGSDSLSVFSINRNTGALSALPFSPIALGSGSWRVVAVHPSGSPVVVGNSTANTLASFQITATSATAASGSPFSTGTGVPFSIAFSQDGAFVYTGGALGNTFAGFAVNASNGVLTALGGSAFASGADFPSSYATDPSGRLFMANFFDDQLRVFTTAAGVPTAAPGNPYASGLASSAVAGILHPNGFYIVVDRNAKVGVYQISGSGAATTLAAVAGSPFTPGGTSCSQGLLNQSGTFLYVLNGGTRNISRFAIDASTGVLSAAFTQTANTLGSAGISNGMAYLPPTSGLLYSLNDSGTGNKIFAFSVNEATGSLAPLSGFPLNSGGNGGGTATDIERLAVDKLNARLYVINEGSDTLSAFSIDPLSGALTSLYSPVALGTGAWNTISIHPSGSPVIVGDGGGTVQSFNVSATAATLADGSPFSAGTARPFDSVFSRDGKFLYTGANSAFIAGYSVDSSTGVLTQLASSPFNGVSLPVAYATDLEGRFFMSNFNTGQVRAFSSDNGILSAVAGNPFSSGLTSGASQGLVHRQGFYLVGDRVSNKIGVYRINGSGSTTTLAQVSGSPFAATAAAGPMTLNFSEAYLFMANGSTRSLTSFLVNSANGSLITPVTLPSDSLSTSGALTGIGYLAPPSDLSVSVAGTASVVAGSGNAVFTVTVNNNGPNDTTGLVIKNVQVLPAGVTLVSALQSTGSFNTSTGVWTIGDLNNGASATLTLTLSIESSAAAGSIINTATISSTEQTRIITTDDSASATTSITAAPVPPTATPTATPCFGSNLPALIVKVKNRVATLTLPSGIIASAECTITGRAKRTKPKFSKSKAFAAGKNKAIISKLSPGSINFSYDVKTIATAGTQTSKIRKINVR
jgi:uncharacterized repeat protein (TIGR01451 family)